MIGSIRFSNDVMFCHAPPFGWPVSDEIDGAAWVVCGNGGFAFATSALKGLIEKINDGACGRGIEISGNNHGKLNCATDFTNRFDLQKAIRFFVLRIEMCVSENEFKAGLGLDANCGQNTGFAFCG